MSLIRFEHGTAALERAALGRVRDALERGGVEFLLGGTRLKAAP